MGLLDGVRVLESSMLLNGASTGMHLADLGAEVIKVESPFLGDYLRAPTTYTLHAQANKQKRSIALDLRKDEGREIFYRLLESTDVVVSNAVGSRNDKIGIGYEQLRVRKPSIVYCQNTGWGATGPWGTVPTHGQMMDAIAGAMPAEMGDDGLTVPWVPPNGRRSGTLMAAGEGTAAGAVYAAMTIVAALYHRERTGEGCYIDVSAAAATLASAWTGAVRQMHSEAEHGAGPGMADYTGVARYQFYETNDGKFVLFCPEEEKFWLTFCEVVDRPDLIDRAYGVELRREIQAIIHAKDLHEWMQIAVEHRLPIGPAHKTIDEVRTDPQMQARGIFVETTHPVLGAMAYIGSPSIVTGHPYAAPAPAPDLGDHTSELLRDLGYDDATLERLEAEEVTGSRQYRVEGPIPSVYGEMPTGPAASTDQHGEV